MINRLAAVTTGILVCAPASIAAAQTVPLERSVQIRSINMITRVIELHNFSNQAIPLNGWQFCTADENEVLKYSGATGFNGRTIAAHGSFYIYWNNNAPVGPTNVINRTQLGGTMATPLDRGPYGLALYFPIGGFIDFNDPARVADFAGWSVGGVHDNSADERIDEAVAAGVWTGITDWAATTNTTSMLYLTDNSGGVLHGPANYAASETFLDCNTNGQFDPLDVFDGLAADCNTNGTPDPCDVAAGADPNNNGIPDACETVAIALGDMNCDGVIDTDDVYPFLLAYTDPAGYVLQFPQCQLQAADMNDDGQINCDDWHMFKLLLPNDRLPRINGCDFVITWEQMIR